MIVDGLYELTTIGVIIYSNVYGMTALIKSTIMCD